jgi:type IV pilus assembly protein PilM
VARAPEKTSIWKKEITLGRKREQPAPPAAPARAPEKTSVWKKEITLGRKRAEPKPDASPKGLPVPAPLPAPTKPDSVADLLRPAVEAAPPVGTPPVAAEPPTLPPDARPAEKTSIWKKEITLGRKRADAEPAVASEATQPEKSSIWKKEITLGRKREQPEPAASAPEAAQQPEKISIWKKEITLGRKRADAESAVASETAQPEKTSIWKKEITLGRKREEPKQDERATSDVPVPAPPPTPEPVAAEPELPVAAPPVAAEPSLALPPVSLSESAPLPPAPTQPRTWEPEPQVRPAEKPSIWKKEITLGRKREQPEPAASAPEAAQQSEKTSVWKKEITLGRKRKQPQREEGRTKGVPVPAPLPAPPKPDSVAGLLRPLADTAPPATAPPPEEPPAEPALPLPPVSPSETTVVEPLPPLAPTLPPAASQPPAATPPSAPPPPAAPPPALAPPTMPAPADLLEPAPLAERKDEKEEKEEPSKRERRDQKQADARVEKDAEKHAKQARKTAKRQVSGDPTVRRHKRLVGLKLGGSQIAAAEIVNNGTPRLNKIARVGLERGVIVGGEVREVEDLAAALKAFFREHKLPRKSVRLGISNNRIGVRTFEISGIDDNKQLANAIRFRAQETLPIPLDEAVLDYRILKESVGEDGVRMRRVLLVVAHRDLVDRYVSACTKAGLRLVGIDLEAFALLRALGPADFEQAAGRDAGLVVVSLGFDRSTLAVSDGRVCEFTRVIPWGGSSLDVAVARTLDLTPSEADPVKQMISLLDEGEGAGLDAVRADAVRQALRAEVQTFARELVASLRYYQDQPESLGIGEIVIAGGTSQCHGLAEELSRIIGVTVRAGDPLVRLKTSRRLRKRLEGGVGSFATAVGLGIED